MKKIQMGTLFFAIAIGLVAAISANVGLAVRHSTPNDLPNPPHLTALHITGQNTLASSWSDSAGSKPRNFNPVLDFGKHGHSNALNICAKTAASADLTNFELRTDPDCNDYPDDMTPAITTKTRTSIDHSSQFAIRYSYNEGFVP
jgi:hypothetical protein